MTRQVMLVAIAGMVFGCDKAGMTDVEIRVNDGFLHPSRPIEVAPDLAVGRNDYVRWDGGFRGRQRIEVNGPVTLVAVPGMPNGTESRLPDSIVYIGRRPPSTTAIEINRRTWKYRRVDVDDASGRLADEPLRERLGRASWRSMVHYRFMAIRNLLWTWRTTNPTGPYASPESGTTDTLILHPYGVLGTTGDAPARASPPEWSVLIHALREFCPPHDPAPPRAGGRAP